MFCAWTLVAFFFINVRSRKHRCFIAQENTSARTSLQLLMVSNLCSSISINQTNLGEAQGHNRYAKEQIIACGISGLYVHKRCQRTIYAEEAVVTYWGCLQIKPGQRALTAAILACKIHSSCLSPQPLSSSVPYEATPIWEANRQKDIARQVYCVSWESKTSNVTSKSESPTTP